MTTAKPAHESAPQETAPDKPWFDTSDIRSGAFFNDDALALLPLVGQWQGDGVLRSEPEATPRDVGLRLLFAHNGGAFLSYGQYAWQPSDGEPEPALPRESGFWALSTDPAGAERLDVSVVTPRGQAELFDGQVGELYWAFASAEAIAVQDELLSAGERRDYRLHDDALHLNIHRADGRGGLFVFFTATLTRAGTIAG